MRMYHFTDLYSARDIAKHGITNGCTPLWDDKNGRFCVMPCQQWLTLDGNFARQSWATRHVVKLDRTFVRFALEIPETDFHLKDWAWIEQTYGNKAADMLRDGYAGWENWRVYNACVPKKYIIRQDKRSDVPCEPLEERDLAQIAEI